MNLRAAKVEAARILASEIKVTGLTSEASQILARTDMKTVVITGEDAQSPSRSARTSHPKLPPLSDQVRDRLCQYSEVKDKVNQGVLVLKAIGGGDDSREKDDGSRSSRERGSALKEYADAVKNGYERAREAKEKALAVGGDATGSSFKEANRLIDEYRDIATKAPTESARASEFLPPMERVTGDTIKQIDEWRAARQQQFELESEKERLDRRKATLDAERDAITEQWKTLEARESRLDPEDPRVVYVRKRLVSYQKDRGSYSTDLTLFSREVEILREKTSQYHVRAEKRADHQLRTTLVGTWKIPGGWYSMTIDESLSVTKFQFGGWFDTTSKGQFKIAGNRISIRIVPGSPYGDRRYEAEWDGSNEITLVESGSRVGVFRRVK
jgi:hypothetical protein